MAEGHKVFVSAETGGVLLEAVNDGFPFVRLMFHLSSAEANVIAAQLIEAARDEGALP